MSYNPNFYNNFCGNNSTFQSLPRFVRPPPYFVPPPPQPPPFFIPSSTPASKREEADQEFLRTFEARVPVSEQTQANVKPMSISEVREEIRRMLLIVNYLKDKERMLSENISALPEEEWRSHIKEIEENKASITKTMSLINGPQLDMLRKLLAKRSAKRLRLKRVHMEKKKEKEERIKELKERSRKIDENLQKIQDDINRAKQEEENKLQADIVLKEVLRKKSDAKKCLTKLDALLKLRKARQNTALGRGETVSDSEAAAFNTHIDKLKSLWSKKLLLYEREESDLRVQLNEDSTLVNTLKAEAEQNVASNLAKWRETLFGGKMPQVDFGGNVERFVAIRSQWDTYISREGTSLPVGWVPPSVRTEDKPS
ncbi:programmed cell death protein 7 [Helicoverpa armigera]|uniref:programmed cell death protein 7 n=1 Tax=Helicoverpa armigera TaxID=29058 RepID=UPI003083AE86